MPQQRMDIRMIKDILRLKYQGGLSHDRIAQSLSISKGAVAKYLSLAGAAGLDWVSTVDLDEAVLERRLVELHSRLPVEAGRARQAEVLGDSALGDREAPGDPVVR